MGLFESAWVVHAMLTALLAARNVLGEQHHVWAVNTEQEYHEAKADPSAE